MNCSRDETAYQKNYPGNGHVILKVIGAGLILAGVVLLVLCIPGWAWLSLIGIALITIGILLILQ